MPNLVHLDRLPGPGLGNIQVAPDLGFRPPGLLYLCLQRHCQATLQVLA